LKDWVIIPRKVASDHCGITQVCCHNNRPQRHVAEHQRSAEGHFDGPTNYSWAYEMVVADPDGHALRIGSDPKDDVPFND
jgi:hypothetical protein